MGNLQLYQIELRFFFLFTIKLELWLLYDKLLIMLLLISYNHAVKVNIEVHNTTKRKIVTKGRKKQKRKL